MDSQPRLTKAELLILGGVPLAICVLLAVLALRRDTPAPAGESPSNLYERVTPPEKTAAETEATQSSSGSNTQPTQTSASTGAP